MDTNTSELVIELAKSLMELMRESSLPWSHAYFRFESTTGRYGSTASYVSSGVADILDPFTHAHFFEQMNENGKALLEAMGRSAGVVLLRVDLDFDYKVLFEFVDLNRWTISKTGDGTGIPVGL